MLCHSACEGGGIPRVELGADVEQRVHLPQAGRVGDGEIRRGELRRRSSDAQKKNVTDFHYLLSHELR